MFKNSKLQLNQLGKTWATVAITTVAIGVSSTELVRADTTAPAQNEPASVSSSSATSSASAASSSATSSATSSSESSSSAQSSVASSATSSQSSAQVQTSAAKKQPEPAAAKLSNVAKSDDRTIQKLLKKYHIKNIKKINKHYYYVDSDGDPHTNVTVKLGNHVLNFRGKGGALVNGSAAKVTTKLVSLNNAYTAHNGFFSVDANSITTTDGFLTADSWYRPKQILKDGLQWVDTASADMRPLLMSWWPNKQVEVNYLNYMNSHGLGVTPSWHEIDEKQSALNNAAEAVQTDIEKRIGATGSTDWLHTLINGFVSTQSIWNGKSEDAGTDSLQGGSLLYGNHPLTQAVNSDYRLLNRAPANQTGQLLYHYDNWNGSEFLLADDVDNSNPVVQAEDLNWLYYMMNIGSIVANDPTANFDGMRMDAVDNMDADLLQISADYFKDAYQTNKNDQNANQHLSILEDWSQNDAYYLAQHGQDQLTIDDLLHFNMMDALNSTPAQRADLGLMVNGSLVDRSNDTTQNQAIPNYFFVRAHDSGVQDILFQIIKDKINPQSDGAHFTDAELTRALNIYNQDINATDKQYTYYNIPASYALLLTNKDTVPRVYYGDMYTDDGQYMATKSPYFDSIQAMLTARVKYVAGGQSMAMNNGVLTSVRYGAGAQSATDAGDATTRTSGIAVVESNQPTLKLAKGSNVVIHMGAAHKNQAFRPLMLTTLTGLQTFASDADASGKTVMTDANWDLTLSASQIHGYSNPQVSGYLAMWVPVGASDNQDVRTAASTTASTDGNTLHSNSALDSNVIFESFSNFQSMPSTADQAEDAVIAQVAPMFKQWGITSVQLPPQYRSVTGNDFLDSTVQNGYAFSDRYDMGYGTPTKYGTIDQLLAALRSLHAQGIQAIADFVPDQLYGLTGTQVVAATRVDAGGTPIPGANIYQRLYAAQSLGTGTDYQAKFGGKFLAQLQQMYPDLFQTRQLSTGKPIDASQKITQWSAKYLNGTNIQGRGAEYVLSNGVTDQYFSINGINYLPKQLLGQTAQSGFVQSGQFVNYYSTSGYQVKNSFVNVSGHRYYFDQSGKMVVGFQKINGSRYFFLPNGTALTNSVYRSANGNLYYFGKNGAAYQNGYYQNPGTGNNRYFLANGVMAKGRVSVQGIYQYFDTENGDQAFGEWVGRRYYDPETGNEDTNQFASINGCWYYFDQTGRSVRGATVINGQSYYFNQAGAQVKGEFVKDKAGRVHYYAADSGMMVKNHTVTIGKRQYRFDAQGVLATN